MVTIYSLYILLFLFGTSVFVHVWLGVPYPERSRGSESKHRTEQNRAKTTAKSRECWARGAHTAYEEKWYDHISRCRKSIWWVLALILEKAMAPHSSVLAWRIPGKAEPGGLPSVGSHRVVHDWSDLATAAAAALIRDKSSVWNRSREELLQVDKESLQKPTDNILKSEKLELFH